MALKKLPFEYFDANRPSFLEDAEMAGQIDKARRTGWEFLSEQQLDENLSEWSEAAHAVNFAEQELAAAHERILDVRLLHVLGSAAFKHLDATGVLTTHKYRADHGSDFPSYRQRPGYPVAYETALGLHDYVCFSFEGYSLFSGNPDTGDAYINARAALSQRRGIVFPFDSTATLANTPYHERPMILQAAALRTQDYLALLPRYIAALARDEPGSVLPAWFSARFGNIPFTSAEVKLAGPQTFSPDEWQLESANFYE